VRKLLFAALLFIAAAAALHAEPAKRPTPNERRYTIQVTDEMRRHSRIGDTLYGVWTIYELVVLIAILATGWSAKLRNVAARLVPWRYARVPLWFLLFSLTTTLLYFPIWYYAGYIVPHQFGLTHQAFPAWLGDLAKGLGVDLGVGMMLSILVTLAMRMFKRWWIAIWLGSIPLMIIGVVIWPLFIDPLFNKFVPLQDAHLRQLLLTEAQRAGIEGGRVYEVDKSKQTNEMNAYVTGIGPSKRIVLWDTLLAKMDDGEILAVMGHEMGHYVLHHLWKGLSFAIFIALITSWCAQFFFERGVVRWNLASERGDPAALPLLLAVVSAVTFLLSPAISGFSRYTEHEADVFSLELTHDNLAAASSFVKLAEDSKVNPWPTPLMKYWRYSHPPLGERVRFALEWKGDNAQPATHPKPHR
jgi:Zn-dependent protease with chaperone function